ncbi:MAG: type II secretion system F family protein [Lachnospiraceae bacterium]
MKIFAAVSAVCGAVIVYNLIQLLAEKREKTGMQGRIRRLSGKAAPEDAREAVLKEKKAKKNRRHGINMVSDKLEEELTAAGIKISGQEYLRLWIVAAFLPGALLALLGISMITVFAVIVIGIMIPPVIVANARRKKNVLFNKQLGESLMVMSNTLRSGYSFQQSMESIAKDMQPPISEEFQITLREMDMGISMETALNHMVERTKNDDVKILVSAVLISSQVGANLADVLDNISGTIQERLNLREQVQVMTAQGRISGLVVGALPLVLFLVLMLINPDYIASFFRTSIGMAMLVLGLLMEVLGFFVISRLIDIKY